MGEMTQEAKPIEFDEGRALGLGSWVLRLVVGLNFVRFALSFSPWFEGTANSPGFADQLFNPHHTNGFRVDFLWLLFSTALIFFASLAYMPSFRKDRNARVNVYLGIAWVAAFVVYLVRVMATGLLDFG